MSRTIYAIILIAFSCVTHADIITFTDRNAFENYLGNTSTDDLSDMENGFKTSLGRPDFAYTGDMYACVGGPGDCGDNSAFGFEYPGYVWTYETGIFDFDNEITGFGLDLGVRNNASTTFALNGLSIVIARGDSSFFGIASDDGSMFSQLVLSGVSNGDLFDNVTYSSERVVDVEPVSAPPLIGIALLAFCGLVLIRRK